MFQHYLSIALRHLVKDKLYSAINIVGLAIGLAACLLIMLFVRDEFSYDDFWPNADNIYRLQVTMNIPGAEPTVSSLAPRPAKAAIKDYFPEDIEQVVQISDFRPIVKQGDRAFSESVHWVDPEFLDILPLRLLRATLDRH